MTFIFYQNSLSIHQSAFIRSLAENHTVSLIVRKKITNDRKKHGWNIPDFGKANIIINPNDEILNQFLAQKDAIQVFSGINSFELPAKAFKIAIKNKLNIGIISEPFNWVGWKGKLRFIKYYIFRLKYNKRIDFILAIGNRGRWCYERTGFSKQNIFDWAYFTEKPKSNQRENISDDIPSFLFIGSIESRKNILTLVCTCLGITDQSFYLNIIGTGPLENELKKKINQSNKIHYLEAEPNTQITHFIENAKVLVLPSIFDGWGAVVNEALMCGTPVISSDNCGASVLLDNKERGYVFSVKKNNLKEILINFLYQLPYSLEKKQNIKNWALQNISGEVAAKYFSQICEYIYMGPKHRPIAPWLKNK
jgi:glycosyltransferase involved in cell wall biosynthesis